MNSGALLCVEWVSPTAAGVLFAHNTCGAEGGMAIVHWHRVSVIACPSLASDPLHRSVFVW